MKKTLPVYYTPNLMLSHNSRGELTFNTLSVADHAMLEGQETRIHDALTAAAVIFRACMKDPTGTGTPGVVIKPPPNKDIREAARRQDERLFYRQDKDLFGQWTQANDGENPDHPPLTDEEIDKFMRQDEE